jgi:hypothetical protein
MVTIFCARYNRTFHKQTLQKFYALNFLIVMNCTISIFLKFSYYAIGAFNFSFQIMMNAVVRTFIVRKNV